MPKTNSFSFDALGTRWHIDARGLTSGVKEILFACVEDFENAYSRFKHESILTKLNVEKKLYDPTSELVDILRYALDVYRATDGLFNISVGGELARNGYGKEFAKGVIHTDLPSGLVITNKYVELADGVVLDFGGFGKAWLIDTVARLLLSMGINEYIVNGGGDIAVGRERQELYIEHPINKDEYVGSVKIANAGMASSSRQKRIWEKDGKRHSHIVNPKDPSKSDSDILSVHVIGPNALLADTFATVFLICDKDMRDRLAKKYELEYMYIDSDLNFWQSPGFGFVPNT